MTQSKQVLLRMQNKKKRKYCYRCRKLVMHLYSARKEIIQFSRFLFPPLVEQNTYINVIRLRKNGHATKRNNVETCKNSINYTS